MKVVILCGGKGTRLKEVVPDQPKILAPIHGKPFLYYLLRRLAREGFEDILLCTGHGDERIREYLDAEKSLLWGCANLYPSPAPYPDFEISFSVDHDAGTGGALKAAELMIGVDRFMVLNGDTWPDIKLGRLLLVHEDYPYRPLVCQCRGVNAGVYILPKRFTGNIPEGKWDLDAVIEQFSFPYRYQIPGFIDMGTPEGYKKIKELLDDRQIKSPA